MRLFVAGLALLALAGCAGAPGRGGGKGATLGAEARARHGADPLAAPPADIGNAEDPAPAAPPPR